MNRECEYYATYFVRFQAHITLHVEAIYREDKRVLNYYVSIRRGIFFDLAVALVACTLARRTR